MATPQNPPQPGYQPPAPAPEAKKPTLWIVLAAVAALVAIGFAIWAFSLNSDLDKANAKVKDQQEKIATASADAKDIQKNAEKIEAAQIAEYNHTRRVLSRSKKSVAKQREQIAKERGELRAAQQQVDEANTRQDKLQAQINLMQQQLDVAQACSRGTISAIDSVFSAPTAKAGVNRLTAELASLEKDCKETIGT